MAKKTFGLGGLIGYLQGIGLLVKHNASAKDEDEAFEVETNDSPEEEDQEMMKKKSKKPMMNSSEDDPTLVSEEELQELAALARNHDLMALVQNGDLLKALQALPAAAQLVQNAQLEEKTRKDGLIAQIKANGSNPYSDEELGVMPVSMLVKTNAMLNVDYGGMGLGAVYQNSLGDEPLGVPSSSFVPEKE